MTLPPVLNPDIKDTSTLPVNPPFKEKVSSPSQGTKPLPNGILPPPVVTPSSDEMVPPPLPPRLKETKPPPLPSRQEDVTLPHISPLSMEPVPPSLPPHHKETVPDATSFESLRSDLHIAE
ncbi:hypothetical protein ACOMHN_054493 [Nucella lapillus]